MFELSQQSALLSDVNPRAEKHGEDTVMAADLKIEIEDGNDLLAELHPTLKSAFYYKADSAQADLIVDKTHAPDLRFPLMGTVPWALEIVGAKVTIAHGIGGKSDIVLPDCKVNAFRLDMQQGGSVAIGCRIQGHPDAKQIGLLCEKIQTEIEITIEPPEPAADATTGVQP